MKKPSMSTIITTTVGVAILACGGYSATASVLLAQSASAYQRGDYDASIAHAHRYGQFIFFERHKVPFNTGTALAAKNDLDGAEDNLRRALELTPRRDECAVRQNLSAVIETKSENAWQSDKRDDAKKLLDEAQKISTEAPEECRQDSSPQDQRMEQAEKRMDDTEQQRQDQEEQEREDRERQRQQNQQNQQDQNDNGDEEDQQNGNSGDDTKDQTDPNDDGDMTGSGSGDEDTNTQPGSNNGEDTGSGSKQEQLEERNRRAQERQNNESGDKGYSGADKPW